MNGPQDLGGQMGFGPVAPEQDEPIFHAEWEKRAMGLVLSAGGMGLWGLDASRHARENRHPADYYGSSYYEIWIKALETLLAQRGVVTSADLAAGAAVDPAPPVRGKLRAGDVPRLVAQGSPYGRPVATPARYAVGDRVRAVNINPATHTRLPRYARGKLGTIAGVHGGFVFPDSAAHGGGDAPQHLYTVVFDAGELWGSGAFNGEVSIDAFESYLGPA